MKNKVLLALMVMVIKSTLVIAWPKDEPTYQCTPRYTTNTSTGRPTANLNGKMVTLSHDENGITFLPPNLSPTILSTFYEPSNINSLPTPGWSVCLRYRTDSSGKIFTLSPGCRTPITLNTTMETFCLSCCNTDKNFVPNIKILSVRKLDIWTRVCVTVDTVKYVAQLFSGSNMSIRKMLRLPESKCSWTGEPVITISEFEGQVTDIQMWDYPLNYREVSNYMNYRGYPGSVLTWSDISYTVSGNMIFEDAYEKAKSQSNWWK